MLLIQSREIPIKIVEGEQLLLAPRWQLYALAILLGDFSSGDEYVELYNNTVGLTGEYEGPHEFRFNKESLRLEALTVYAEFLHKSDKSVLQTWRKSPKKAGLIYLTEPTDSFAAFRPEEGDLPDMRYEIDKEAHSFIVTTNESIIGNQDRLRLTIANDFDLLFYDGVFCGWQLFHPTQYLIRDYEQPHPANRDAQLPNLLLEYLELAAVVYSMKSPAINPELHTALKELRSRIEVDENSAVQRHIIRETTDYLINITF